MRRRTSEMAKGYWPFILQNLGLSKSALSGKHGPCPMCGGKDRFRFTDFRKEGDYYCSGCGSGSGFDLIKKIYNVEFREAAKMVDETLNLIDLNKAEPFNEQPDLEKRRRDMNRMWLDANEPQIFLDYLESRGLNEVSAAALEDLRGHPSLYDTASFKHYPAMIALIRDRRGQPVSIHRTYLGQRRFKKVMPCVGDLNGASIRLLWDVLEVPIKEVVIGEGIETTLAGCWNFGFPGLATISANGMEKLQLPDGVEGAVILADNDKSFTGQKAAFTLARRLDNEGKNVEVVMSREAGNDYLDYMLDKDDEIVSFWNGRSK